MKLKITKKQKAFTLIELLVSVLIIGILILVGTPYYNKYIASSEINANLTSLNFYKTSIVVCLQTESNYRVCNGGTHSIPKNFNNNEINGIQSIDTKMSIIEVVSKTFSSDLEDFVKIKYKPLFKNNVIEWEISCNDYDVGTIVDNCSKQYEEVK